MCRRGCAHVLEINSCPKLLSYTNRWFGFLFGRVTLGKAVTELGGMEVVLGVGFGAVLGSLITWLCRVWAEGWRNGAGRNVMCP